MDIFLLKLHVVKLYVNYYGRFITGAKALLILLILTLTITTSNRLIMMIMMEL